MDTGSEDLGPERELRRQKVRVRYRERTKLKKRPRGYYIKRFLRKYGYYVVWIFLITSSLAGIFTWLFLAQAEKEKERIETQDRVKKEQESKKIFEDSKKKWQ